LKYEVKLMKVVDDRVEDVPKGSLDKEHYEEHVESWIEQKPEILGEELIIIDRQPRTTEGKKPDLLGLDSEGNLVIIEVKNEKAERDVIGQVLDYASQLADNTEEDLERIASTRRVALREAFRKAFGDDKGISFGTKQRMIVVAPELDASVPRIMDFLARHGLDIEGVTFGFHKDGSDEYLTRGLIRPERISVLVSESIVAYFKSPPHLASTLGKIREFLENENCYFGKPRGNDISFFSEAHRHRVGTVIKQKRAILLGLHPNYWKEEEIDRVRNMPLYKVVPYKDRKTASGGEIIDWVNIRNIRKPEDFQNHIEEIKKAMVSLDEYYSHPEISADWKRIATGS